MLVSTLLSGRHDRYTLSSTQGKDEREACYVPIKDALVKHFEHVPHDER